MRLFLLLAFLVFSVPSFVSAFEPTGTLDDSPEANNRQVKRSINLEALRDRLRQRFSQRESTNEVAPVVQRRTVVRRASRVSGSVNTVGYTEVGLKNLAFSVSVPEGFSVTQDTLTHMNGMMKLQSGSNSIMIQAAGLKCPPSGTNLRNCVQSNTKAFADTFVARDSRLQFLRQRQDNQLILNTSTDSDPFGSERDQVVESLELQSSTKKLKVLGFASPEEEYLWYLVLEGNTDNATSIGHDHQALYRIFNSLSGDQRSKTIAARMPARRSYSSRDRFRTNYRFRANTTDIKPEQVFEARHIPELRLHLDVLSNARQVEDGAEGAYVFRSGMSEVSVTTLEEECTGNTSNLLQRCLRERLMDVAEAPEGFRVVTEKNILMELDKSVGYKNHLGRYILWQDQDGSRQGILLFRHPWEPTVFRVDFSSNKSDSDWAYNDVLLNRFFGSFYFDERE